MSTQTDFGSDTSFATAIGGGLDYHLVRPVAWRLEGDYVQTRFFSTTRTISACRPASSSASDLPRESY